MTKVIVVDEKDQVIGAAEKEIALKQGFIRRIVRVFVSNSRGELFLQRRSANVETYPDTWDQSAGGHVDVGESYEQAARRELKEELGIEVDKLKQITRFYLEQKFEGLLMKEYSNLFITTYDGDIKIDKDEVSDGRWFSLEKIKNTIENEPESFPPGFIEAFKRFQSSK